MDQTDHKTPHTIEITGHLSPEDRLRSIYRMLPFDVPAGTARLEVSYSFSDDDPGGFMRPAGNILDIGLFDARGSEFLHAEGFRGWSGSNLRKFSLTPGEATPGYLPGPIPPGRWEVILGLHNILPQGCDYQITVKLWEGAASNHEPVAPPPWPVLRQEPGWYRGDLHCHSHHSDGTGSLADPQWLDEADSKNLLDITPSGNLPGSLVTQQLQHFISSVDTLRPKLDEVAKTRAQALKDAHTRIRQSAKMTGTIAVTPVDEVDILGCFILLPDEN